MFRMILTLNTIMKSGDAVYAQMHMVCINQANKKKHLIQFPTSTDLQKVRKLVKTPCPTVLLKADTGADVNLLNSSTFDKTIGNRSLLQPSTLWMEAYRNSTWYPYLESSMHS